MAETGNLQIDSHGDVAVVYAPNYINADGGEQIGAAASGLLGQGVSRIVLDLNDCALANSVGISFLIEVLESVKDAGGHLAFCCVSPTIAKTLQIMGLLQSATLHEAQDEAVKRARGDA
ncbi:STAS domain-containing protein [Candidatus Latescibacterota bacterium]